MPVGPQRVGFARWRSDAASGGNNYDEQLVAGLRSLGVDLREYDVSGPWPTPGPDERRHLAGLLPEEAVWLIGNIVGSAAPELIGDAVRAGRRVVLLVHYFPADDVALSPSDRQRLAGSEAAAVRAASAVVVTSAWAAGEVARRYGRDDALVARPGFEPAEVAPGSQHRGRPPMLLWLGRLTEAKDPLTFVDALARISDLEWTARLVGPDAIDAALADAVRRRIAACGLSDRVDVPGPIVGSDLDPVWAATDLLVHTSRAETYGMVVAEALARGIPSVVADGTGAVEAQGAGAGAVFQPGEAEQLAAALRGWLSNRRLRDEWRAAALAARERLPRWDQAARVVLSALST